MEPGKLPEAVRDVAGPLQEAAGYETLQWQRRRGAYGGLVALALIALGLYWLVPGLSWLWWAGFGICLAGTAFAFWARRRPAWTGVFLDRGNDLATILFQGRRSRFGRWVARQPRAVRIALLAALVFAILSLSEVPLLAPWVAPGAAILLFSVVMYVPLGRLGDRPMQVGVILASLVVPAMALGLVPASLGRAVWNLDLGAAWLIVALVRVFAPRRWLVR
jgi:hypothetical protein